MNILGLVFLLLCVSSAQRAAAFQALTTWRTYQQIPNAIGTGAANFMTDAEASGVTFQFGQSDFTDDFSVRSYVGGYAAGFTTEQICLAMVGAGIAGKAGTAAKIAIASTDVGQKVLDGVDATGKAVQRFKSLSVDFAINAAKKTARTTGLPQVAETMADAVSKMSYDSTRTVGQVINQYVDRLDIIQDELAKIGKPLNDFGVKAQAQLAKLLDRDLGSYPGEKAMRGDIKFYDSVVTGNADRYDEFVALLTKSDGTIDKNTLQKTLELYEDAPVAGAGGNWAVIGEAADPTVAAQLTPNACGCATAQTLLADRGVTVFQSNIATQMGQVLATDDGIVNALSHFEIELDTPTKARVVPR